MPASPAPDTDTGPDVERTIDVLIGICTYRRPGQLDRLLDALGQQRTADHVSRRVVVVDNSPDLEAGTVAARPRGLAVRYVPLGAGNIAVGRNRVLAEVPPSADFVALIDDDEVPEPDWLQRLLDAQRATNADLVTGPVLAAYPQEAPAWFVRGDFLSVAGFPDLGPLTEGITGNALLRSGVVEELQLSFDESLGLAGGEDQLFFRTAHSRGARIHFAARAIAHESVPPERLTLRYLLRGEFRRGNTLGLLDRSRPGWPKGNPVRRMAAAVWWSATGALRALTGLARRDRTAAVAGLMRLVRAAGMVVGLLGVRYDGYAVAPAAA